MAHWPSSPTCNRRLEGPATNWNSYFPYKNWPQESGSFYWIHLQSRICPGLGIQDRFGHLKMPSLCHHAWALSGMKPIISFFGFKSPSPLCSGFTPTGKKLLCCSCMSKYRSSFYLLICIPVLLDIFITLLYAPIWLSHGRKTLTLLFFIALHKIKRQQLIPYFMKHGVILLLSNNNTCMNFSGE